MPKAPESEQDREYWSLVNQIDSLEEFLYDDYGDTVDQLGQAKTDELEKELIELKAKRVNFFGVQS